MNNKKLIYKTRLLKTNNKNNIISSLNNYKIKHNLI